MSVLPGAGGVRDIVAFAVVVVHPVVLSVGRYLRQQMLDRAGVFVRTTNVVFYDCRESQDDWGGAPHQVCGYLLEDEADTEPS